MNTQCGYVKVKTRIGPFSPGSLKSAKDIRSVKTCLVQDDHKKCHMFSYSLGLQQVKGQQVNDLFATILLLSEIAVIRIKAHTNWIETEHQENALADFHAQAAAAETIRVVAYVNEVLSAFEKMIPCCPTLPIVILGSLQHSNSHLLNQRSQQANWL